MFGQKVADIIFNTTLPNFCSPYGETRHVQQALLQTLRFIKWKRRERQEC